LGAPRRTPPEVINKLNKEVNSALADLKFQERLAEKGGMAMMGSPTDFSRLIVQETEKWAKVVKFSGAKVD
jgi:tripartite-type tricarboxylate transporter receptor subunit TctC